MIIIYLVCSGVSLKKLKYTIYYFIQDSILINYLHFVMKLKFKY